MKIEGTNYDLNDFFVGRDKYLWVEKEVTLLSERKGCKIAGLFNFGKSGDGFNSSFESLLYLDGAPYQSVDTYHNEVLFTGLAGKRVNLTFLLWTGLEGGGKEQIFFPTAENGCFYDETSKLPAQKTESGYYVLVECSPFRIKNIKFVQEEI